MITTKARPRLRWAGLTLATILVLAACGDDDGDAETAGDDTTGAETATSVDAATEAACDAYVAIERAFSIDEDPEAGIAALQDFVAAAPADVAAEVEPAISPLEQDVEAALESAEVANAETTFDRYAFESCGDTLVEMDGVDFAFSGIPSEIEAGRVVFRFSNESLSGEFHEALVLRRDPAAEGSAHDALVAALGEAPISVEGTYAVFEQMELVAVGFVEPEGGDTEDMFAVDMEPGEYVVACLLPANSPETLEPYFAGEDVDGHRHLEDGMFTEVTVT